MPNWCENILTISGSPDRLKACLDSVRGEGTRIIDADKIAPYPEHFAKADKEHEEDQKRMARGELDAVRPDGYNHGGYDWCLNNWGTKWNLVFCEGVDYELEEGASTHTLSFDTAWSPPIPLFAELAKKWPDIEFELEWVEHGMQFCGTATYANGECCSEEDHDYAENYGTEEEEESEGASLEE